MDTEFKEKISLFLKQNWIIVILIVAGLICLGYGLITLTGSSNSSDDIVIGSSTEANSSSKMKADIEGEVVKPGVYELSSDARLQDLVIASGGLSADADREWVAKNINLASRLSDGTKIYIPKKGEQKTETTSLGQSITGLININSATSTELDTLPGIGPATAQKIIQNRPYQTLEELVSKKAVGQTVFDNIKDKVSIY